MTDMTLPPGHPMIIAAATMHEMFLAYQQVGFTRAEALELVKTQLTAMQSTIDPGVADVP